jgi:hypothetical protein
MIYKQTLGRFIVTTLTFEELASLDGMELGAANSPYAVIGLTISKAVVQGRERKQHFARRGAKIHALPT